jgi:hypothetical protein
VDAESVASLGISLLALFVSLVTFYRHGNWRKEDLERDEAANTPILRIVIGNSVEASADGTEIGQLDVHVINVGRVPVYLADAPEIYVESADTKFGGGVVSMSLRGRSEDGWKSRCPYPRRLEPGENCLTDIAHTAIDGVLMRMIPFEAFDVGYRIWIQGACSDQSGRQYLSENRIPWVVGVTEHGIAHQPMPENLAANAKAVFFPRSATHPQGK